ncbi:MAG: zinc-dependent alcohol dehydrogenase family protein [Gammaproteobacteria bacterium]
MKAMVLHRIGAPLQMEERTTPTPNGHQALIKVHACGVCRTDLHVVDGELPNPRLPIVPGHEIIGEITDTGELADIAIGQLVAVPWLGWTCGQCEFCQGGQENLCDLAKFTGYQLDGGYAEYTLADARYCIPLDSAERAASLAPLVCAGLIGYRSLTKIPAGRSKPRNIGIYGFGAAAHIIAQIITQLGDRFYAFTRPHDTQAQNFACLLGASWAGDATEQAPVALDGAIIFAPAGELVPVALANIKKGGTVVCGGIHMSDIPNFKYELLWGEREVCSVANLTRSDGVNFFDLAKRHTIKTHVTTYPLESANDALNDLRHGKLSGAAVLLT